MTAKEQHMKPWIQQLYGKALDLNDPQPEQICFHSMAVALSRINRFDGHTSSQWSVLQHLYLVKDLAIDCHGAAPIELWALLHDAHEAALGDIATPVVLALEEECSGAANAIGRLKWRLDRAIIRALDLPESFPDDATRSIVEMCDERSLELERQRFLSASERAWETPALHFLAEWKNVPTTTWLCDIQHLTWLYDIQRLAKIVRGTP